MNTRLGVDTGGTFTDLLCLDERGLRVFKLRSTPSDPSVAILAGIRMLVGDDLAALALEITHGSTVATNAVLERKGARVALLATAGFEDVVRIGRQTRPELYNFNVCRPAPLVSPALTFGVGERLAADGSILQPLRQGEVEAVLEQLLAQGVESAAVCFLHSYANPVHEQQAAAALRRAGLSVSTSHEILPEYREYERWSTTVVNAYVSPLMERYLQQLQLQVAPARLRIMQSNGGSISAARAGTEAVQTILSGPAAGVVGAQASGEASGFTRLITFDMGGTSTDVSLIDNHIGTTNESLVGDLPVRLPVLDIHTVGAGGGSIAWVDAGGSPRVGPHSAGADPGPVCFGTGRDLTVTDANLLLGRLDPGFFLGGRLRLDLPRTEQIAGSFAAQLNLSTPAMAEGIVRIANANMERAIRVVSVQRGFDPRDFALLAFGGAGGLHACELADSLEITTVLIPEHSGVLSALGMLLADVAKDYSTSVLRLTAELTSDELLAKAQPLIKRAEADLAAEGFAADNVELQAALAMRYKGQAYEIDIPMPAVSPDIQALSATFHHSHGKRYGYSNTTRPTEVVQLRLRATGHTSKPALTLQNNTIAARPPVPAATRQTVFNGKSTTTPIYDRSDLKPGHQGSGPSILITGESTNLVPPHWYWRIDSSGTLILTRAPHAH
jgi:N-methylhydantoinase A/oxoprolinase/acetone carboxylase beta subunit